MKKYAVIGLGSFGYHVAKTLLILMGDPKNIKKIKEAE